MAAQTLASAFASAKKTSEELVWDGDDDESGDDEDGLRETLVRMSLAAQQETQASHVAFAAEATGLTPRSGSSSGTSFFAEPVPAAPSPDGHLSLVRSHKALASADPARDGTRPRAPARPQPSSPRS